MQAVNCAFSHNNNDDILLSLQCMRQDNDERTGKDNTQRPGLDFHLKPPITDFALQLFRGLIYWFKNLMSWKQFNMQTFIQTVSIKKSQFTSAIDPTFMIRNSFVYPANQQAFKLDDFSDLLQKDHTMSTTLLTLTNPLTCSFLAISRSSVNTFRSYWVSFFSFFCMMRVPSKQTKAPG